MTHPRKKQKIFVVGLLLLVASAFLVLQFYFKMKNTNPNTIRYVALGDSYTIGEGAGVNSSWPKVLTDHLKDKGIDVELVAKPSVTGYTTQDLIDYELDIYKKSDPTFATLLIGVNDWVRGVTNESYKKNLIFILDEMQKELKIKTNIVVVTIPDFTVTPQGALYTQGKDAVKGIQEFNEILKNEADKRGIAVVDIFPVSQEARNNPDLISYDGLHPSEVGYAQWEKIIMPVVLQKLEKQ